MSFGLPRYHIAPNIYSMRKLRSSAAERHVGYLGAKQQPCSEKVSHYASDISSPLRKPANWPLVPHFRRRPTTS